MKIDSKRFSEFLSRITVGRMVEEVTFTPETESICTLVSDSQSRMVIKGIWQANTGLLSPFTAPSLSKMQEAVKTLFPAEIELSVFSDILTLESDTKSIKLEVVEPKIYPALSKSVKIHRDGDNIKFQTGVDELIYSDSVKVDTKDFVKSMKECIEIIPSPKVYYSFDGNNHSLTSTFSKNSMKNNLSIKDKFTGPKSVWMFNFVQEIFKQNGPSVNLYLNKMNDPIVISYKDADYDIITVSTPYSDNE